MERDALNAVEEYVSAYWSHARAAGTTVAAAGLTPWREVYKTQRRTIRTFAQSGLGQVVGCEAVCLHNDGGYFVIPECRRQHDCTALQQLRQAGEALWLYRDEFLAERNTASRLATAYFNLSRYGEEAWTLAEHLTRLGSA